MFSCIFLCLPGTDVFRSTLFNGVGIKGKKLHFWVWCMLLDWRLFCSVRQILRKCKWNSKKGVNNNIRGWHVNIFVFPFVFLRESKQSSWSISKCTFKLKPTCDYCIFEMETNEKQYCAPVHPSLFPIYHSRFSLFCCFDCAPTGVKNTWGLCGIILSWGVYSQASRAHLYYICTLGKRCMLIVPEKPALCTVFIWILYVAMH